MKIKRKIIQIDEALCNGCGQCMPSCPEQAIQLVETPEGTKARLVKELYCDGLGACLGTCPTGALTIEEREADPYDDQATIDRIQEVAPELLETHRRHIEEHTAEFSAQQTHSVPQPFACPSARMLQWDQQEKAPAKPTPPLQSELRQWPVQLHLVPPTAPYLKNAELVVCADCVPFAYANFHQEFLKGAHKAIVVGCPKLDDTQVYLDKFVQILTTAHPRSITIVNMEVPCCFGLVRLIQQAIDLSGQEVPLKTVTISIQGDKLT